MSEKKKTIIGIDYSLTSPAVCILFDQTPCFYYLTGKKKYEGVMSANIVGDMHKEYNTPIQRFTQISDWAMDIINEQINPYVFIEGYSFGSKGQAIFQIAENCGILKYRLEQNNIPYETIVPSVVKKFATGKGNADKEKMYDKYYEDSGVNLMEVLDQQTLANPVTDIVDSYYIARCGYENSISNKS